jgi:hypothetical protein
MRRGQFMWEANKKTQDWHKENLPEVRDKEVWPSNSPGCKHLDDFVLGVSELMVNAKPHNKTEDLILKIKEVMVSLNRTPWQRHTRDTRPGLRLSSLLTAILLNKWILNLFICNFVFICVKSDDLQWCCDNL